MEHSNCKARNDRVLQQALAHHSQAYRQLHAAWRPAPSRARGARAICRSWNGPGNRSGSWLRSLIVARAHRLSRRGEPNSPADPHPDPRLSSISRFQRGNPVTSAPRTCWPPEPEDRLADAPTRPSEPGISRISARRFFAKPRPAHWRARSSTGKRRRLNSWERSASCCLQQCAGRPLVSAEQQTCMWTAGRSRGSLGQSDEIGEAPRVNSVSRAVASSPPHRRRLLSFRRPRPGSRASSSV